MMCCTQCSASKIALCLLFFFWIWLAVIFLVSGVHDYQEREIVRRVKKKLYHIAFSNGNITSVGAEHHCCASFLFFSVCFSFVPAERRWYRSQ